MKNIFENAYFGKAYKTRDGRKAIYGGNNNSRLHSLMFQTKDDEDVFLGLYNSDGLYVMAKNANHLDIVSEWENLFDENKMNTILDDAVKLRETAEGRKETGGWYWRKWAEWGYRKALNS